MDLLLSTLIHAKHVLRSRKHTFARRPLLLLAFAVEQTSADLFSTFRKEDFLTVQVSGQRGSSFHQVLLLPIRQLLRAGSGIIRKETQHLQILAIIPLPGKELLGAARIVEPTTASIPVQMEYTNLPSQYNITCARQDITA